MMIQCGRDMVMHFRFVCGPEVNMIGRVDRTVGGRTDAVHPILAADDGTGSAERPAVTRLRRL